MLSNCFPNNTQNGIIRQFTLMFQIREIVEVIKSSVNFVAEFSYE